MSKSPKSIGPRSVASTIDRSKSVMSASVPDCAAGTGTGSVGLSASSVAEAGAAPVPAPASNR